MDIKRVKSVAHMPRGWRILLVVGFILSVLSTATECAVRASITADDPIDTIEEQAQALLSTPGLALPGVEQVHIRQIAEIDGELRVCLAVPRSALAQGGWSGIEVLTDQVMRALYPLGVVRLSVQAWDPAADRCRPLSDLAPRGQTEAPIVTMETALPAETQQATAFSRSLAGKTIYVSAGHGWFWNGSQWRTQRPVYQGFIEDHNNAEVVTQFLIPYLENAGARVIPVRERDWSSFQALADNDAGPPAYVEEGEWGTGSSGPGYAGGTYRYAIATSGPATAVARWMLTIPTDGTYAVYAWVYPGTNRVPDAHYTIHHAGGATGVTLDQRLGPRTWRYLGTFPFHAGTAVVTLDNRTDHSGTYAVIADAIRVGGGTFDRLDGLSLLAPATTYSSPTPPSSAPGKPWWEVGTFYWSQVMGLNPDDWPYFNDVVARPMMARWYQRTLHADAVYLSWHTNGSRGDARGTVSYVHNGETYPRTPGSLELQAAVHQELVHDIRAGWDPNWTDRGMGQLNLGELRMLWDESDPAARIPGVLLEIAFHDNYDDAAALKEPLFEQLAARAVYQGIVHYFEQRDGINLTLAPEPPTHLRVQNLGGGALRVTWHPSPTDDVGLRGDPPTAYRVYTSHDGLAWETPIEVTGTSATLEGLTDGETLYVKITAINAGGESFPTETAGARVGDARLLLVNGFDKLNRFGLVVDDDPVEGENLRMWIQQINSRDYIVHHGQAVPIDIPWDSSSNEAVSDGEIDLTDYDVVDWILGEEASEVNGSLDETEREHLKEFLRAGKSLMVSGSEFGWDLVELGRDPAFLPTELHTQYVADDAETYTARATSAGALSDLGDVHFDAPDEYDVDYPDILAAADAGALAAMTYIGGEGGTAVVQFAAGCQRLLVMGFPFETLRQEERPDFMAAAMEFLWPCQIDTRIVNPGDGSAFKITPVFTGTVYGTEVERVELQLQTESGSYWSGTTWSAQPAWFVASGVNPWSYLLLAMGEGTYTLRARAVGTAGVDQSPDEVQFIIDHTAPRSPVPIAPQEGAEVMGPVVTLRWQSSADDGSLVSYEVHLDSTTVTVDTTSLMRVLGEGAHVWQVRALDAAGNTSAWSAPQEFQVNVERVWLPLVLKVY